MTKIARRFIVGTAGHIDHGKTALVRALTGIDADRLPEEKARGITIDLGFAHLSRGDARIGFVDVPGHERFVRNMLAGAGGIDAILLVVAADEGIKPQTREHFAIAQSYRPKRQERLITLQRIAPPLSDAAIRRSQDQKTAFLDPLIQSTRGTFHRIHAPVLLTRETLDRTRNTSNSRKDSTRSKNRSTRNSSRGKSRTTNGSRDSGLMNRESSSWSRGISNRHSNWSKDTRCSSRGCKKDSSLQARISPEKGKPSRSLKM